MLFRSQNCDMRKAVDSRDNGHTAKTYGNPIGVECEACKRRLSLGRSPNLENMPCRPSIIAFELTEHGGGCDAPWVACSTEYARGTFLAKNCMRPRCGKRGPPCCASGKTWTCPERRLGMAPHGARPNSVHYVGRPATVHRASACTARHCQGERTTSACRLPDLLRLESGFGTSSPARGRVSLPAGPAKGGA